jgi:hypothetical protein
MIATPAYCRMDDAVTVALAALRAADAALLPVVENDDTRKLVGVVTLTNLLNAPKDATVFKAMNPAPIVIHSEDDFEAAAAMMKARNLMAVPVVDKDRRLDGVLYLAAYETAPNGKWSPLAKAGLVALGAGLGAGAMFLLDPNRGRARRAMIRDKTASLVHQEEKRLGKAWTHLTNNLNGVEAGIKHLFECDEAGDQKLTGRVRTKLGRVVNHPHDVQVLATHGNVILRGKVKSDELPVLEAAVRNVRGVRSVETQVAVH